MTKKTDIDIHVGQMIRDTLRKQGRSVTWFANTICYERSNAYKIFRRRSIDLALLIKISEILQHDFLEECSVILQKQKTISAETMMGETMEDGGEGDEC